MEMIIGRKGQQSTPITDLSVSREHCKLTSNPDGTYTLENLSASGTFVNDRSIIRTVVNKDTVIRLGGSFTIAVKDLLPASHQDSSSGDEHKEEDYTAAFRRLKGVYDKYSADKIAIQKEAAMSNFYRMLPMTLMSLLGLGAAAIPALGSIAPIIAIVGMVLLVYSLSKSYTGSKENPEKMEALNRQFMIDYVCPKCGNFLGYVPFEALANKKQCSFCKCKWV